jgi:hypothetical protein
MKNKRFVLLVVCIVFSFYTIAQVSGEILYPLAQNPYLPKKTISPKVNQTFDSTFIYFTDTLQLPFFDEFSKNHFQKYPEDYTLSNVTSQKYFVLLDMNNIPFEGDRKFSSIQTYRRTFNQAAGTFEDELFEGTQLKMGDLSSFPPSYVITTMFPPFIIFDTIDFVNPSDTIWLVENIVKQDSATQFFMQLQDKNSYWLDNYAYHNYRYAVNPWTLGVVTFDGLDDSGYPYAFGTAQTGYADFLTSKPIDLSSYAANDSLYFSFLYQKEGFGDIPEESDSLVLEFYVSELDQWFRVWSVNGGPVADFKKVHFVVKDDKYFDPAFQFRFKNYGAKSGSLDHFHIDYVHLRPLSGYQDTLFKDFAFVYPVSSLLKDYTSVPWDHYKNNPLDKMTDKAKIVVRNGSNVTENSQNGAVNIYYDETLEGGFSLSNFVLTNQDPSQNYAPRTIYESFHDFSSGYRFDENKSGDLQAFDVYATASAQFPNLPQNDSSHFLQEFYNYYAYDDGSAEQAYGIIGSQALLAYQFTPYEPDSLIGVMMHFVPTVNDVSNKLFLLTVWADSETNPGTPGEILYQDDFFFSREPEYTNAQNTFVTYYLKDTMKLRVDGTFYVGWKQVDADRLNIGFDRNTVNNDKLFFSLSNGFSWTSSVYEGTVMMRPVFSTALDNQLGIKTTQKLETVFEAFPNPSSDLVHLKVDENLFSGAMLIDIQGKVVSMVSSEERLIDVRNLPTGVYFLKDISSATVLKIIKN